MINWLTSNPAILNEARDYLDGLLLGDGCIPPVKNSRAGRYEQSCKYKEWLDKINEDLYEYGIECSVNNGRLRTGRYSSKDGSIEHNLWTRRYIEFKEMHDRWYKRWYDIDNYPKTRWHESEGGEIYVWKKIIPKDISLTPLCVANWYLGDGTCSKRTYSNKYQIYLSTEGFLRKDIIFASELLSNVLDIKCSMNKAGKIYIGIQSDIITFLNYMRNYEIPDCCDYKFPSELI